MEMSEETTQKSQQNSEKMTLNWVLFWKDDTELGAMGIDLFKLVAWLWITNS